MSGALNKLQEAAQRKRAQEEAEEQRQQELSDLDGPQPDDYLPPPSALLRPAHLNPAIEFAQQAPAPHAPKMIDSGDVRKQMNVRVRARLHSQIKREAKISGMSLQDYLEMVLTYHVRMPLTDYPPDSVARLRNLTTLPHPDLE